MKNSSPIGPKRTGPAYRLIEKKFRDAILSGELPYGSRLPAAEVLAAEFQTSASTIHAAMGPLMKSGLLERKPKRGTFVRGHANQLVNVGIYSSIEYSEGNEWGFLRELNRMLVRELSMDGVHYKMWIDSRPQGEQDEPLSELKSAILNKEIQGLIIVHASEPAEWLTKSGIPWSRITPDLRPAGVFLDRGRGYKMGLEELKKQGCSSVGAILSANATTPWHAKAFQALQQAAIELGMELRDEWLRVPPTGLQAHEFEQFGYHQFQKIWKLPKRPDGLLVFPDIMVRGVITSILHLGVRVPDEFKVVLHRNENIPILCPFAATWLVTSVQQIAVALIEQIKRQLTGKQVAPIELNLALERSSSL